MEAALGAGVGAGVKLRIRAGETKEASVGAGVGICWGPMPSNSGVGAAVGTVPTRSPQYLNEIN